MCAFFKKPQQLPLFFILLNCTFETHISSIQRSKGEKPTHFHGPVLNFCFPIALFFFTVLFNLAKTKQNKASEVEYGLIRISSSNHFVITVNCLVFKLLVPRKRSSALMPHLTVVRVDQREEEICLISLRKFISHSSIFCQKFSLFLLCYTGIYNINYIDHEF